MTTNAKVVNATPKEYGEEYAKEGRVYSEAFKRADELYDSPWDRLEFINGFTAHYNPRLTP